MPDQLAAISFVSVIVDRPRHLYLSAISGELDKSSINGHRILATRLSARHRHDEVDIPHPGHSFYGCKNCEEKHGYVRNFDLELVIEGAYRIADPEYINEFRLSKKAEAMISIANVLVMIVGSEPIGLLPWENK